MGLFGKKKAFTQSSHDDWHNQWQSAFPPECRDVPVTHDGKTFVAYVLVGHTAMMLQDGLLMQATFFDVCEHFQRAGYHVVWLMRCTQLHPNPNFTFAVCPRRQPAKPMNTPNFTA